MRLLNLIDLLEKEKENVLKNESLLNNNNKFWFVKKYLNNFKKGQLNIVGGRTGTGKTTFLINLLEIIEKSKLDENVILFSLEQTSKEIIQKLISILLRKELSFWNNKEQSEVMFKKFYDELLKNKLFKNLFIIDKNDLNVESIENILKTIKNKTKKENSFLLIDHIQILGSTEKSGTYEKVSHISRELKKIAVTENVCVIALSQLSRESAKSKSLPTLTDLRDSGSIEQDADVVVLLSEKTKIANNVVLLNASILKNRNGGLCVSEVLFNKSTGYITQNFELAKFSADGGNTWDLIHKQ
ncbi:hypothetical protein AAW50_03490 [Mycoplasmopsis canis]|uniref:DnaB-like helicase C-terminal domain-containing protein n=1 Tax=Mycoplasmopsis canis TaxID=29555 RepID=UPI0006244213|nr:DnaB-like helicase C-terminal domain-containing protein [Mycoplasmopsis canis]AKF41452.1 hypothetical protein AAW50_03490 [Mycoplasmopsis canis]